MINQKVLSNHLSKVGQLQLHTKNHESLQTVDHALFRHRRLDSHTQKV